MPDSVRTRRSRLLSAARPVIVPAQAQAQAPAPTSALAVASATPPVPIPASPPHFTTEHHSAFWNFSRD